MEASYLKYEFWKSTIQNDSGVGRKNYLLPHDGGSCIKQVSPVSAFYISSFTLKSAFVI